MKRLVNARWAKFMLIFAMIWGVGTGLAMASPAFYGGEANASNVMTGRASIPVKIIWLTSAPRVAGLEICPRRTQSAMDALQKIVSSSTYRATAIIRWPDQPNTVSTISTALRRMV